jgi:hypothetical protein
MAPLCSRCSPSQQRGETCRDPGIEPQPAVPQGAQGIVYLIDDLQNPLHMARV